MARWAIVVWAGLAVAAAGLLFPSVWSTYTGPAIWMFIALLAVAAVVAWLAMRGDRRVTWVLVLTAGLLSALAILSSVLVLALSLGQSPITEGIGWPLVAVGTTTALVGSLWGLRAEQAPTS